MLAYLFVFAMTLQCISGDRCFAKYTPHEVIASSNGEKTYQEGGLRTLAARRLQGGGCRTSTTTPTGTVQGAQTALTTGAACSPPVDGKLTAYVGIALYAKGWTLKPSEIVIRGVRRSRATVALFGMRGGRLVQPKLSLFTGTALRVADYEVKGGPDKVLGVARGSDASCNGEAWRLCAVSVSFGKPVDSIVVLLADDSGGAVQVGAVYSKCGCRCRLVYEEKKHLAPARTPAGTCWWGASSIQYHKCADQGIDYCSVHDGVRFVADAELVGERNVPCSAEPHEYAVYEQPFMPHLAANPWSPAS